MGKPQSPSYRRVTTDLLTDFARTPLSSPPRIRGPVAPFALFPEDLKTRQFRTSRPSTAASRFGSASGYKKGGPYEIRERNKILNTDKPKATAPLFPIKVSNISRATSPEHLREKFQEFGEVGDVYIPMNYRSRSPTRDFAIVRFVDREAASKVLDEFFDEKKPVEVGEETLTVHPVDRQIRYFTANTVNLPITSERDLNQEVLEDQLVSSWISRPHAKLARTSYEPLSDALARMSLTTNRGNPIPWPIEPSTKKEALEYHAIRLGNLPMGVRSETIREYFLRYGPVASVFIVPDTAVATGRVRPNSPIRVEAVIRFIDKRDLDDALKEINRGRVAIDGRTVTGTHVLPRHLQHDENSRRFY